MKKTMAMLLSLLLLLSLSGCRKTVDDCLIEKNNYQYLVLPRSKAEVNVSEQINPYLSHVDYKMLKRAEKVLKKSAPQDSGDHFYLYLDDEGYLCLGLEVIEGGHGDCVDHDHRYYLERITEHSIYDPTLKLLSRNDLPVSITVSSYPESYNYTYDEAGIAAIIEYLNGISLSSEYAEYHPCGFMWIMELEYSDGAKDTIYQHSPFISCESGGKYRISDKDASGLDSLISKHGIKPPKKPTANRFG